MSESPVPPATPGALIRRTLSRQRRALAGAIGFITLWQVCEAAVPVLIGVVIDQAIATGDVRRLLLWGVVLCVHFAVLSYAYRFGSRLAFRGLMVESHALRSEVSAHVLAARGSRTDRLPGEVLTIATSDAEQVGRVIRQVVMTTAALIGLVVSGVALAFIDPLIAVVVLAGGPVVLVCTQVLAPRLAHRSHVRQESLGRATGRATDLVRGLRPLKGIGAEDTAIGRYREQSHDAARASVAAARWEGVLYGVTGAISVGFLAAGGPDRRPEGAGRRPLDRRAGGRGGPRPVRCRAAGHARLPRRPGRDLAGVGATDRRVPRDPAAGRRR